MTSVAVSIADNDSATPSTGPVYLPLVAHPPARPDLTASAIHSAGCTLEVVVANQDDGPVSAPFWVAESNSGGPIAAGAQLYAHADSAAAGNVWGVILEQDEQAGVSYNTIAGAIAGSGIEAPAVTLSAMLPEGLSQRPHE